MNTKTTGLIPLTEDPRDRKYRFTRMYGATALANIPDEFSTDPGLTDPDQMRDNRPTECTAYSKTDMATDMTGQVYEPDYTFAMTLREMNKPPETQGASLRDSFKAVIKWGLLLQSDAPDHSDKDQTYVADYVRWLPYVDRAQKNAQASYRWIYDDIYDHFDDIRSAIITFHRTQGLKQAVDFGIPWFSAFARKDVLRLRDIKGQDPNENMWHDVNIKGWKIINGEPYLVVKHWESGKRKYFSRDLVNYLGSVRGVGTAMFDPTGNRAWSLSGFIFEQFPFLLKVPGLIEKLWRAALDTKPAPVTPQEPPQPTETPKPTVPTVPPAHGDERLIQALMQVESDFDDYAIGDKHLSNRAYGCLQIRKPVCDDVNRVYGTKLNPEQMLGNRPLSIDTARKYWNIYLPHSATDEEKARVWNGGPTAYKPGKKQYVATNGYWAKVKKHL